MQRQVITSLARTTLRRTALTASTSRLAVSRSTKLSAPAGRSTIRSLSSSASRLSHGENDASLSAKLQSELEYEQTNSTDGASEPDFLKAFKSAGVWSIEDKAGADEIALKRKFGNEEIKVLFSIADIDNSPESEQQEGEEGASETPDAEAEAEAEQGASLPIRTAITISKGKGQGAMTIDAVAQDGTFLVDNISLYNDEAMALDLTSEADWARRGLYMGPAFDNLDESLQTDFEAFLEERGIDSNLALFIPDLAEFKEQKEYVKWLDNVKRFIEA